MKRRITGIILSVALAIMMVACGGSNNSESSPQSTPEPTSKVDQISSEELAEDIDAVLSAALDYFGPEEEGQIDVIISNRILERTHYEIVNAYPDLFEIAVSYPDVAYAIKEVMNMYNDVPADEAEFLLYEVLNFIEQDQCPIIDKVIEVDIIYDNGTEPEYNIVWTDELYNAFTGGLYNMEQEA